MKPPAFVVGLCSHGLAVARSLGRRGVDVHALEADPALPGLRTRFATVHMVPDINGYGLLDGLRRTLRRVRPKQPPVLFLTNDNMVRILSETWDELEGELLLSWAGSRDQVQMLVMKHGIERYCREAGVAHPRSVIIHNEDEAGRTFDDGDVEFVAVKPVKPLSGFKVRRVRSSTELVDLCRSHAGDLPFIAQQWIPGDDRRVRFCNMYLAEGQPLAHFEGRRLTAIPPTLGAGATVESRPDEPVYGLARAFFARLKLSGPAAVEFKLDPHDKPWLIEPTVGRTEYFVQCGIAAGIDLPYVQYAHLAGLPVPVQRRAGSSVWVNTERGRRALLACRHARWGLGTRVTFPLFATDDLGPFVRSLGRRRRAGYVGAANGNRP